MTEAERVVFGIHIRILREAKGLSLRDAEKLIGISNSYLYQIERGDRNPPKPEVIRAMSAAYGVSFNSLMAAAGLLAQEEVNLYHDQIERAFEFVRRDPKFQYGMQSQVAELSIGTKRFIVELYEELHGGKLKLLSLNSDFENKEAQ